MCLLIENYILLNHADADTDTDQLNNKFEYNFYFFFYSLINLYNLIHSIRINALKIRSVIEPKKLSVHGSLVGPVVVPRLNC